MNDVNGKEEELKKVLADLGKEAVGKAKPSARLLVFDCYDEISVLSRKGFSRAKIYGMIQEKMDIGIAFDTFSQYMTMAKKERERK